MGSMALLMVVYLAFAGDGLFSRVGDKPWIEPIRPILEILEGAVAFASSYIDLGGATGSLAAISVAGCLLGTILAGPQRIEEHGSRLRWAAGFAGGLFVGGLLCDSFAGINKIAATPTWCLLCASLTCLAWIGVYQLMDVRGVTRWSVIARPAGANPLIAYLLHPILVGCLSLTGLGGYLLADTSSSNPGLGVVGSVVDGPDRQGGVESSNLSCPAITNVDC